MTNNCTQQLFQCHTTPTQPAGKLKTIVIPSISVENPDALTPIRRFILALNVTGVRGSS